MDKKSYPHWMGLWWRLSMMIHVVFRVCLFGHGMERVKKTVLKCDLLAFLQLHFLMAKSPRNLMPNIFQLNSLVPNDVIRWQRSGSTLAQVMACCLTAPSHYLNQCWLIISKIQLHSSDGDFTRDTSVINDWNWHENYSSKMSLKSPRGQWVKIL